DYGRYLRDRLAEADEQHPGALQVVARTVTDLEPADGGFRVYAEESYAVDAVVLAYGNPPPTPVDGPGGSGVADRIIDDPWDLDALGAIAPDATVLVIGTGLTAVDTAVTLLGDSERRHVVMASRHGLLPRAHVDDLFTSWLTPIPDGPLTADQVAKIVTEQLDAAAERGVDWRAVVDGLRQPTQSIWRRLDVAERRLFLERYAREWEVRRHRMAPAVAALVEGYRESGRLEILAGGVAGVEKPADRLVAHLADADREVDAVVNCTGPSPDITRTDNPLLRALQKRGLIAPDALRLGLAVTETGEVLDADGQVVAGLRTVGPPRKGVLYETTAVPEIRRQAAEIAELLTR
ncbi:MAG: FAD/NAD(P)-binding protein, partial [Nocardioides sp.]|nr:FAD/NAD(P)-binding protein [Nocardioides sp.]